MDTSTSSQQQKHHHYQQHQRDILTSSTNRLPMHHETISKQPEPVVMIRDPPREITNNGNGENTLDAGNSPSRTTTDEGVNRHMLSQGQVQRVMDAPADDASVGIMAAGLAWVNRNRYQRRRQYLQHQAEQQLRKIAEAERPQRMAAGLNENATFQQMSKTATGTEGTNDSHPTASAGESSTMFTIGTPELSKSGEGASAQLDWDLGEDDEYLIPQVRVKEEEGLDHAAHILTPEQMHQIAIHVLPKTIAFCQWRRLYGLGRDGDSFAACLQHINSVQRTLMVVRTTRGAVFGGYADSPWQKSEMANARFYGSAQASLFSVAPTNPDKVHVYKWTGKNRYIQLCDVAHKMLAFGGGGDDGAFGLCIEEDFQKGSTGSCDTFGNEPLCDQENFEIVDLEFWEFLTGVF
jgi:hypothetical protein